MTLDERYQDLQIEAAGKVRSLEENADAASSASESQLRRDRSYWESVKDNVSPGSTWGRGEHIRQLDSPDIAKARLEAAAWRVIEQSCRERYLRIPRYLYNDMEFMSRPDVLYIRNKQGNVPLVEDAA
jgi:hypothetical protein